MWIPSQHGILLLLLALEGGTSSPLGLYGFVASGDDDARRMIHESRSPKLKRKERHNG